MPHTTTTGRTLPTALVLFLCLFAAQTTPFVLAPLLPRLAGDFSVPVAAIGQLRTISACVAAVTTFALGALARRLALRDLIAVGLGLLALGSVMAALSLSFAMLAAAHVIIGAGMGIVLTGATAAAAQWTEGSGRTRLLSWTLMGPPAAAIVATLAAGLLADTSWRIAWLVVPLAAAMLAAGTVATRPRGEPIPAARTGIPLRQTPGVPGWAIGELLAYSAWSGVPVYAGALLIESYGASPAVAAVAIGACASAFLAGNLLARRWVDDRPRPMLVGLSLTLAATAAVFAGARVDARLTVVLLVALGLLAGARALTGSALGLALSPQRSVAVMGVRTTAQQTGYLVGAGLGGLAIAVAGYTGLAFLLSTLFLFSGLPHALALTPAPAPAHGLAPAHDDAGLPRSAVPDTRDGTTPRIGVEIACSGG